MLKQTFLVLVSVFLKQNFMFFSLLLLKLLIKRDEKIHFHRFDPYEHVITDLPILIFSPPCHQQYLYDEDANL